jgi:hypothetical protein
MSARSLASLSSAIAPGKFSRISASTSSGTTSGAGSSGRREVVDHALFGDVAARSRRPCATTLPEHLPVLPERHLRAVLTVRRWLMSLPAAPAVRAPSGRTWSGSGRPGSPRTHGVGHCGGCCIGHDSSKDHLGATLTPQCQSRTLAHNARFSTCFQPGWWGGLSPSPGALRQRGTEVADVGAVQVLEDRDAAIVQRRCPLPTTSRVASGPGRCPSRRRSGRSCQGPRRR